MVSSMSSINSSTLLQLAQTRAQQKLTAEQQTLISDTLAEFDAENLSEADALSIVETLSAAGIEPGAGLEAAVSDLGFDLKTIAELAGAGGDRAAPPPPQSMEEISSMASYLTELLDEKLASSGVSELSDQERQDIYSKVLEKFGIEEGDSLIDTTA